MRRILILAGLAILAAAGGAQAQVNTINTVAGGGAQSTTASTAYLPQPYAAVRDSNGNTYISVPTLDVVYEVTPGGAVSIYAGTGISGFSGDGGSATQAQLSFPEGLAIDKNNNLFIADFYNNRIRRVDGTTHTITTVAGSGDPYFGGFGGDGGPATGAKINLPQGVAVDANENIYIADTYNGAVRMVSGSTGVINTIAGGGANFGCPSGPSSGAAFAQPTGIAVDQNGNVFVSDATLNIVCKITSSFSISTYAGNVNIPGTPGGGNGDGGPAASSFLLLPHSLAVDATGDLFIADSGEPEIRKIDTTASHIITTVAGIGLICGSGGATGSEPGCGDGGTATSASLNFPEGVFVDANQNIVIADSDNMRVRVVGTGTAPAIAAFAGGGSGGDGALGTGGIMGLPQYVAVDKNENVFALETNGERLRELNAATGKLSTVAGDGYGGATVTCVGAACSAGASNGDGGPATQARFVRPDSLAFDANGNVYILDYGTYVLRAVNMQTSAVTIAGVTIQPGDIQTIAGNGQQCGAAGNPNNLAANGCGDGGQATSASLMNPYSVAVDVNGVVYIADPGLSTVRAIGTAGVISTFAGTPGSACTSYPTNCGDFGVATSALLNFPAGLAAVTVDSDILIYIADSGDNVIRQVDGETGVITTYAFNGIPTFGGDDGMALQASMNFPEQVAADSAGNVYVGGGNNNLVRRIDVTDGTVLTVAGDVHNLDGGFSGDGGPSTDALISNFGLAIFNTPGKTHDLFIADTGSNRVREVRLAPSAIEADTLLPFGPALPGATNVTPQSLEFANDGLDALILTVTLTGSNSFTIYQNCLPTGQPGVCQIVVSPGNEQDLTVSFNPPVGAAGTLTGNLAIATNDAQNPTYNFGLTGTIGAPVTLNVTISPAGANAGFVESSDLSIFCPVVNCSANFPQGATVTLIASGNPGFGFQNWNVGNAPDAANCASDTTGFCSFTLNGSESIIADFQTVMGGPTNYTVTVIGFGNGSGTVTGGIAGGPQINCTITNGVAGATGCSATFTTATAPNGVQLTATGSVFVGYTGECSEGQGTANQCTTFPVTETVGAVYSGPAQAFQKGQVFLDVLNYIFVLDPTSGNVVQVLKDTLGQGQGMAFDSVGNLYVALQSGFLSVFSPTNPGAGPTAFGNNGDNDSTSVVFDPSGNALVSNLFVTGDEQPTILQFKSGTGPTGGATATYYPGYERPDAPDFWMELLADGKTVAYTLGTTTLKAYNLAEGLQYPDIAVNLHNAHALRQLGDDTLLVADNDRIVRITPAGNITQTYTVPGSFFESLNLDPDGVSFWTADEITGKVYRINLGTGAVMNNGGNGFTTGIGETQAPFTEIITGIAVFGQPQSGGADLAVTMTAPASVQQGANIVYNVSVVNNGPLNATGVTLTASIPNALPLGLSPSNCAAVANGSVTNITCALGNVNSGQTVPATFTMSPTITSGTITATANISGGQPDPDLTNNTATTNTTIGTATQTFTVTLTGTNGSVVDNDNTAILCSITTGVVTGTCSFNYNVGVAVSLQVSAGTNSTFTGWTAGPCSGTSTNPCTFTISANTTGATAAFAATPASLSIAKSHTGNFTQGQTGATYTVTVSNGAGAGPTSGTVTVTENPPTGLTVTGMTGTGWTCTAPSCTRTDALAAGASYPAITVTVTVAANAPASVTNGVTVSGGGSATANATNPTTINTSGGGGVAFTSTTLPAGAVGVPYGADIQALVNGGTGPYTVALQSGSTLPAGFTLEVPNGTGDVLQGHIFNDSPATTGTFTFGVTVTDSSVPAQMANATLSLTIGTVPNTQAGLLSGPYAVEIRTLADCGASGNNCPAATSTVGLFVGSLNFDGKGGVTGVMDANTSGNGVQQDVSVTGTYSIGPDNRGYLVIPSGVGGTGIHAMFSVGTVYRGVAYSARFTGFRDDDGMRGLGTGFLQKQVSTAFNQTSFAGTYVYANTGQSSMGLRAAFIGLITFDNALNVVSGIEDINEGGTLGKEGSITGTYTAPDANGRTVLSLNFAATPGGTITSTSSVAVYIVSANSVISMTLDARANNDVNEGTAVRQANPGNFTASSLAGPDVTSFTGVSNGGNFAGVGLFTISGTNLTVTLDHNDGGTVNLGDVATGTFAMAANGRATFSVTDEVSGAPGEGVIYLAGQDTGYVLIADSSVAMGPLAPQVGGPFAGLSFGGNVYFGQQETVTGSGGEFSGATTSVAAGTLNAISDESHAGGDLFYGENIGAITYSVDAKGHVTGQVTGGSGVTGYLVSPYEVAIFDTTGPASDPAPSTHPNLTLFQTVAAPPGTPSPATSAVSFSTPVAIGGSAQSSPVTITNTGLGPLGISGTGVPPDFSFANTSTCINGTVILQPGESCTIVITFMPSSGATPGAQLNETLTATTDGTSNITINASGTVLSATTPALSITKTHTGNFSQGQQGATYTATVSNAAGAGATSGTVTVTENPPTGLTVTTMAGTGWTCTVPNCTTTNVLAAGASYPPITITVNVAANAPASLTNSVSVTGGGSVGPAANGTDPTQINQTPALGITKSHTGNFFQGEQGATYTVTVSNAAGAGATSGTVTVTENAPAGLTVTNMSGTGWSCTVPTSNTCTRSDVLAAGASYPAITVTVNVSANATGSLTNSVTVSGGGSANATATNPTTITPPPALSITKTHTGNFVSGLTGTYTVTVSNAAGAGATVGTVTVTDNAPSGLTISTMTGTGWTCTAPSCTRTDSLAAGASYPAITVTVSVGTDTGSTLVNSVTVSGGGSANATANDSTTIVPPAPVSTLNPAAGGTVAFGGIGVGSSSKPMTVTITNTGNANLNVGSVRIFEDSDTTDFSQTSNCISAPLTPAPGAGSSCTINVTFTPSGTGQFTATLTITTNDPNNPTQSLTLTGTGSTISLVPTGGGGTTVTVNPGGSGVIGLTLNTPPGTTGTVTLTCVSPDASIKCTVVPGTVMLTGSTIQTAIVLSTYCQGSTPVGAPKNQIPVPPVFAGVLALLAALMMAAAPKSQRKRLRLALAPALLAVILMVNAACGSLPKSPTGAATPPGTYTLDITATLGNSSFTLPVTLVVQ